MLLKQHSWRSSSALTCLLVIVGLLTIPMPVTASTTYSGPSLRLPWLNGSYRVGGYSYNCGDHYTGTKDQYALDFGLPDRTPVTAVFAGILHIGVVDDGGYGTNLWVQNGTYRAVYAHLTPGSFQVQDGHSVSQGQVIALSGWSGNVIPRSPAGAHLHFSLRDGGVGRYDGAPVKPEPMSGYNGFGSDTTCTNPGSYYNPEPGGWWIGPTPSDFTVQNAGTTIKINFRAVDNQNSGLNHIDITRWTQNSGWQTVPASQVQVSGTSAQKDAYTELPMPNAPFMVSANVYGNNGSYQLAPSGIRHFCPSGICNAGNFPSGTAWTGGTTGYGGGPAPDPLNIVDPLTLSPIYPKVGQMVTAKFSVQNITNQAVTIQSLGAATREGTSWSAPAFDFPAIANVTVQPGQVWYYSAQRSFNVVDNNYFAGAVELRNNAFSDVPGEPYPLPGFSVGAIPAPTQADQQSMTIYDESLATGWQNWSWSSSVNLADPGRPYSGSKAIFWQPNAAYAGLFLHNDTPVNTSGYATLTFAMKGTWSGQTYGLMLYDANGNSTGSLAPLAQLGGDPPTDHYRQYMIPLSVFGAVNTQISGFHIQDLNGSSTPAAAYVDRIMINGNSGDPWINLPANKLLAYNDNLANSWQNWAWDSTINWTGGPPYTGANSISWTSTAGWAGLDIHNPTGVSTSNYTMVHFAMKATQPGEQFAIFLAGVNNTGIKTAIPLTDYGGNPVTGYWKRYDIPLADLGGSSVSITGIVIQSNLGNSQPTVYVDEVGLY